MKALLSSAYMLLTCVTSLQAQSSSDSLSILAQYQKFIQVYTAKDYSQCVNIGSQLQKRLEHPNVLYKLAQCQCQSGLTEQSLALLGQLAVLGLPYQPEENENFQALTTHKNFLKIREQFAQNRQPVQNSSKAFELSDPLLIPEGIAATSQGEQFFIGSLAKNKIASYTPLAGEHDWVASQQDGMFSVLGMKVSKDGQSLWVCSASERDSLNGYSGIFQYDISTGKLRHKYVLDNKTGAHLFNDIVITRKNAVYFTDSKGRQVLTIQPNTNQIVPLLKEVDFIYPNGIAMDEKEENLYVADLTGLTRIELTTGNYYRMATNQVTYLNGIDGLYIYKGTLVAIQDSGNNDDRIIRLYLDKDKKKLAKAQTLQSFHPDFVIPTTGTIVGDEFFYIANSQLRNLNPDGSYTNSEKLKKPLILKLKLSPKI
ncbi:hypothetical protein QNI19_34380 [Cytophagaceae bacterium DM2B3-1]|uniref:SMP-30/Gluconolactonase/LRE-like region domain-containing protein n=1 Tax=Xanthocytophaga flava TaxID=3048013 RepID=A0ABT7CX39_9BACT|nr:hypothetical protein [Xanthocytophaga flavus]MDJ1498081.1 hypothetical protein [Xanthocytophaga flavus]